MEDIIGKGWSFPPHFDKSDSGISGVSMTSAEKEIEGSLNAIFSTGLGERLFRPDFGASVADYQFKPMDTAAVIKLRRMLETAVYKYEPRIDVHELSLDDSDLTEGILRIRLKYSLKDSCSKDNMIYPYYFENTI